jgi:hypothetical protein
MGSPQMIFGLCQDGFFGPEAREVKNQRSNIAFSIEYPIQNKGR